MVQLGASGHWRLFGPEIRKAAGWAGFLGLYFYFRGFPEILGHIIDSLSCDSRFGRSSLRQSRRDVSSLRAGGNQQPLVRGEEQGRQRECSVLRVAILQLHGELSDLILDLLLNGRTKFGVNNSLKEGIGHLCHPSTHSIRAATAEHV